MSRPRSVNEYNLGYRNQVVALFQTESPPPPTTTYISSGELDHMVRDCASPLQRIGRSLDCDLPQHVAEKSRGQLSDGQEKAATSYIFEEPNGLLQQQMIIPIISIDKDGLDEATSLSLRRSSLSSMASCTLSEFSNNSSLIGKSHFAVSQIQRLVNAFSTRGKALKERIAQPPTPSTDLSSKDGDAPLPPPLNLRQISWSETKKDENTSTKKFHIPSTFHPQSPIYICWLFVVTSAFLYNLCGVPLRISFPYQNDENIYSWLVVDYVADVIYLIDTFLIRPRLRFVREGSWVVDVVECRKNYIQSLSSKFDILSLTPLDFFYFLCGLQSSYLRFPRMIRILPFWEFFDRLDMMAPSPFVIRIGRTLFYMLYLIHLNACAYYSYSEWAGIGSDTFTYQGKGNAYLQCFYFALKTATKIGKNPKPTDNIDRSFMIFNWLIGVFACAAIIGQIRDIMASAEKNQSEYRERLDRTVQLMNRLSLPPKIQNRVRMWFTYNWSIQKTLDEKASLVSLPHNMQMDIAMNVHIQTLSKVQLFQDCDPALIRDLVLKLKPVLFLPGDLVCKKGEVGKEMYIVKTGQVQVMGGPNDETVLVTLSEGSVFGEISLLAVGGGNRRMANVKSSGFSNLFVLSKSDLNEALEYHPEAQKVLKRKAKKLVKKSSERQDAISSEPIISNNKPPTPKLVKTVLEVVSSTSKTRQLILHGSRASGLNKEDPTPMSSSAPQLAVTSREPASSSKQSDDGRNIRSRSEEILLHPKDLVKQE